MTKAERTLLRTIARSMLDEPNLPVIDYEAWSRIKAALAAMDEEGREAASAPGVAGQAPEATSDCLRGLVWVLRS